jgi:hypothetical protein
MLSSLKKQEKCVTKEKQEKGVTKSTRDGS